MSVSQEISRINNVLETHNWDDDRASILLAQEDISEIISLAEKYQDVQAMVVIGIGGSNLGTLAVHEAINGVYHNESHTPNVYFADTPDAHALTQLQQRVEQITGRVLYVVISKSGSTAETIANASILVDNWDDAVIITGKNSKLDGFQNADTLHIPKKVGGRYSVFSPVGLFPLAVLGVDVQALLDGAAHAIDDIESIAQQAQEEFNHQKQVSEVFMFAPLQRLGQWRRQLIAESLGKDNKGPLPTTRIGTTDLHSTAQRSLDGPNDTYTTFVTIDEVPELQIPESKTSQLVDDLANKTTKELFSAVQHGVMQAYEDNNRAYTVIELAEINEYTIGNIMQTWMIHTMITAELLGVNAFNQPAVEEYKAHTREALKK